MDSFLKCDNIDSSICESQNVTVNLEQDKFGVRHWTFQRKVIIRDPIYVKTIWFAIILGKKITF